ncbi:MAG TPA: hypothetical protein VMT58_06695, partial [Candidatus Binataceae bacterium]|nr:hypothetical protein [Candidatus Binataceae bacterium]
QCVTYGVVKGKPALTEETPRNPCDTDPTDRELFAADVVVQTSGKAAKPYGAYSSLVNGGGKGYGGANYAFQVLIPAQ